MVIPRDEHGNIPRDQVLVFSKTERRYLIDALMILMQQAEGHWDDEQFTELKILLEHLIRTKGDWEYCAFLGKQVAVTLDREGTQLDGTPYGENKIIRGQLLGIGEGGDFEILEDDGFIHYCWPALHIEERRETGDDHGSSDPGQ